MIYGDARSAGHYPPVANNHRIASVPERGEEPTTLGLVWEEKYGPDGRVTSSPRVALPSQTVETVDESVQEWRAPFTVGDAANAPLAQDVHTYHSTVTDIRARRPLMEHRG